MKILVYNEEKRNEKKTMTEGSMSKKEIQIKFVTDIKDGNRKETVAFETNGLYYVKDKSTYITFEEPHEEGLVKAVIKIKENEVRIIRSGFVSMNHVYKKGQYTEGIYKSQLGPMTMETRTDNITFQWSEAKGKGKLFLTYSLQVQGHDAGRYAITILLKERNNE